MANWYAGLTTSIGLRATYLSYYNETAAEALSELGVKVTRYPYELNPIEHRGKTYLFFYYKKQPFMLHVVLNTDVVGFILLRQHFEFIPNSEPTKVYHVDRKEFKYKEYRGKRELHDDIFQWVLDTKKSMDDFLQTFDVKDGIYG